MAHPQQLLFVKALSERVSPEGWSGKQVLEIGSFYVNGSIRPFFDGSEYLGVDLSDGPGVDLVSPGHELKMPSRSFDLSISCECFEHDPHWIETFMNMIRLTKDGGLVVFTCATTGRVEHGTSRSGADQSPGSQSIGWDYYLNLTENDFRTGIDLDELFESFFFVVHPASRDLYFAGRLIGNASKSFLFDSVKLKHQISEELSRFESSQRRKPRNLRTLLGFIENLLIVMPLLKLSPNKRFHDYHVMKARLSKFLR